jgi:GT2 family glycosyltransferase
MSTKVSIITLNYNQYEYTVECIKSLLLSDYNNFSIYLIDNGSTNENYNRLLESLPKNNKLHIERLEQNIGYVGGINYGLKATEQQSDYFLIMNNDTIIDPSAIKALVETAEKHQNNALVSGKVYNYDNKNNLQYIGNGKSKKEISLLEFPAYVKNRDEPDIGQYDKEMEMGMLDDIFWIIPKKIIQSIGYYSTFFFLYGEQNDYALRAVKQGFKLIYTPKAKLWHKGKITTANGNRNSPKVEYWSAVAVMKLAVLHFEKNDAKKIIRKWVFVRILKNIKLLLTGKSNFMLIKAIFYAVNDFRFWNKIRYNDNGYNPF